MERRRQHGERKSLKKTTDLRSVTLNSFLSSSASLYCFSNIKLWTVCCKDRFTYVVLNFVSSSVWYLSSFSWSSVSCEMTKQNLDRTIFGLLKAGITRVCMNHLLRPGIRSWPSCSSRERRGDAFSASLSSGIQNVPSTMLRTIYHWCWSKVFHWMSS